VHKVSGLSFLEIHWQLSTQDVSQRPTFDTKCCIVVSSLLTSVLLTPQSLKKARDQASSPRKNPLVLPTSSQPSEGHSQNPTLAEQKRNPAGINPEPSLPAEKPPHREAITSTGESSRPDGTSSERSEEVLGSKHPGTLVQPGMPGNSATEPSLEAPEDSLPGSDDSSGSPHQPENKPSTSSAPESPGTPQPGSLSQSAAGNEPGTTSESPGETQPGSDAQTTSASRPADKNRVSSDQSPPGNGDRIASGGQPEACNMPGSSSEAEQPVESDDICPVCQDRLGSELVVLPCGHMLCCR
jgi:hypothetical protein